ncbi:hypothetical protein SLA_3540 [Streptomyces laurentii]|uniref:DUF418 domain-containing protein n=1 Tax=Streptomyces laurentii TaxID=39478 RepID=A0A169NLM0_STRLU|nr:hypothetical protein SLA_3540 [Streptomyces laurentii]
MTRGGSAFASGATHGPVTYDVERSSPRLPLTAVGAPRALFAEGFLDDAALVGRLVPGYGVLAALALFAAQAVFSRWWLERHRYGPVEWVLRAVTLARVATLTGDAGRQEVRTRHSPGSVTWGFAVERRRESNPRPKLGNHRRSEAPHSPARAVRARRRPSSPRPPPP